MLCARYVQINPGEVEALSVSAALHLQTGADWCRSESGETLELLRLPGHQEHIDPAGDTSGTWKRRQADEATRGHCRDVKDTV